MRNLSLMVAVSIDQVGVPLHVAKTLTYPERVTPHNLEKMRALVRNGADVWPGACYLISESRQVILYL